MLKWRLSYPQSTSSLRYYWFDFPPSLSQLVLAIHVKSGFVVFPYPYVTGQLLQIGCGIVITVGKYYVEMILSFPPRRGLSPLLYKSVIILALKALIAREKNFPDGTLKNQVY